MLLVSTFRWTLGAITGKIISKIVAGEKQI